jgi:hypothetical protein
MTQKKQQILNWLEKEKERDNLEIKSTKQKFISEIKGLKKEDLFEQPKEVKLTLWQRIKIVLLGS